MTLPSDKDHVKREHLGTRIEGDELCTSPVCWCRILKSGRDGMQFYTYLPNGEDMTNLKATKHLGNFSDLYNKCDNLICWCQEETKVFKEDFVNYVHTPGENVKDTNPKRGVGETKVPLHLVSPIMQAYMSIAQFLGNVKYGRWNWRAGGAAVSTYYAAHQRHMQRWYEGEELDPDDGTPHLANAMTCLQILIEAKYRGVMEDDRPPSTDLKPLYAEIEQIMKKIVEKYKDRDPKDYTIKDKVPNARPLL